MSIVALIYIQMIYPILEQPINQVLWQLSHPKKKLKRFIIQPLCPHNLPAKKRLLFHSLLTAMDMKVYLIFQQILVAFINIIS